MGTQFWWFYDVMAAAIVLVCIFLFGKKGVMKSAFSLTAFVVAVMVALGASEPVAKALYSVTVRSSNVRKISNQIDEDSFIISYINYLESLGYNIKVRQDKVYDIFRGKGDYTEELMSYVNSINGRKVEQDDAVLKEKIREGYAVVVSDIVGKALNKYAAECAAKTIREDSSSIDKLIPKITDPDVPERSASFINDEYTASAYHTMFRLAAFAALFVIIGVITFLVVRTLSNNNGNTPMSFGSHAAGAALGIVSGGILVYGAAVIVRLWAIMGSDEMLFFNNAAVDKSYVFKYFYELAKLL